MREYADLWTCYGKIVTSQIGSQLMPTIHQCCKHFLNMVHTQCTLCAIFSIHTPPYLLVGRSLEKTGVLQVTSETVLFDEGKVVA